MPILVTEKNVKIGMKVVRGPGWKCGDKDINKKTGKQMVGTIKKIEGFRLINNWVNVIWENGQEYDCRIGPEAYDLKMMSEQFEFEF